MTNELHPLLQSYYAEIDPEKRRKYLEEYDREAGSAALEQPAAETAGAAGTPVEADTADTETASGRTPSDPADGGKEQNTGGKGNAQADAYRRDLYAARHAARRRTDPPADHFLWTMMNMCTIFKSPGIFPKHHKREVRKFLQKMQLDDRPLTDKACQEVLYREYRNAVRRYFDTCRDSSYGRSLFGMKPADEGRRAALCCNDIWSFSYGIAHMVGLEEEMALLCRAANDEYCALVPEAESLDAMYRKYNKK